MPKIRILPSEIEINARAGETIMEAAHDAGLFWPTTCGGQGICTTCLCTIESGMEHLEPASRSELKTMTEERSEATIRQYGMRLACQARVLDGDITVNKRGVRAE
ncbi:MAG: 2Fe-2S iron-sulfur cluster-binding protein [Dehalococcoidia bacterium]